MIILQPEMIRNAMVQNCPTLVDRLDEDDDSRSYLEGVLMDEDSYEDVEALVDLIATGFLDDNHHAAKALVNSLLVAKTTEEEEEVIGVVPKGSSQPASSLPTRIPASPPSSPPSRQQGTITPPPQSEKDVANAYDDAHSPCPSTDDDDSDYSDYNQHDDDNEEPSSSPSPQKKQQSASTAASRKEKRNQRKLEKGQREKEKSLSPRQSPKQQGNNNTTNTNKPEEDLTAVVARIQKASAQGLQELDDYASAWEKVKQQQNTNGGEVVWGGRGHGGRGINRGLAAYRGRDAVVHNLTLSYGDGRDLLMETHLAISHGHRYGLMGPNGVGKTTLLRRIAAGQVPGWPLHLTVDIVEQEVLGTNESVVECMTAIGQSGRRDRKKHELQEEIDRLEETLGDADTTPEDIESAAEQLSELFDQLEGLQQDDDANGQEVETGKGAWSKLDARANKILKGLQFPEKLLEVPGVTLSGGWRMRLALARALYAEPDVLLLDEPTNHLDLSAVLFLETYLVSNNMTIVVVSHDGHFLDAVCTDMIKFENCKLKYHVGNYSSFRKMEEQTWARNSSKADAVARKEKKAMEFIQKQRSMTNSKHRDDNKQKQAAERQKKLGRIGLFAENGQKFKLLAEGKTKKGGSNRAGHITGTYTNAAGFRSAFVSEEKHALGEDRQLLNFKFPAAPPLKGGGTSLITMEDCRFRYPTSDTDAWLLQDVTVNISYGSKIAIVGKNGAGKSTLLKILTGELMVNGGEFHAHPNLKVAHISQHHIEQLADYLEKTPVEYFLEQHKAKDEQEARQYLGGFGLVGPLALQMIGTLSGGQKARLAFATVMCDAPQLLILDEPTNHLDEDSLQCLAAAVKKFEGAVAIVSHNQDFMAQCAKEMWTVANSRVKVEVVDGEVETFDDAFVRYRESLRKELR